MRSPSSRTKGFNVLRRRGKTIGFGIVLAACLLTAAPAGAATITPNITDDEYTIADANCSLREAVKSASLDGPFGGCENFDGNLAYGADTIVLNQPNAYELDLAGVEDLSATGDLDVSGSLLILGNGLDNSVVTQTTSERVFHLQTASTHLTLRRVSISGGDSGGGGAGILADEAGNDLTLDRAVIANGEAGTNGGGVRIAGAGSSLSATDTTFSNNVASSGGGGASIGADVTATFTRTFFHINKASSASNGGQSVGGGIDINGANVDVIDSTFEENIANSTNANGDWSQGGAIRTNADTHIEGTLFEDNRAFSNGPNTAEEQGGAIYAANPGPVEIVNSTFYSNDTGNGAPADDDASGGAIFRSGSPMNVRFSTFLLNSTTGDGADSIDSGSSGTDVKFSGNLFAVSENVCEGGVANTFDSEGYNVGPVDAQCGYVGTDDVGGGATALVVADPAVNGGPTRTIALGPTGRGLDFVPFAVCATGSGGFDARNYPRSGPDVGSACDAGAYERTLCNGVVQNDDFTVCPLLPPPDTGGGSQGGTTTTPATTTKCKKAKKKKGKKRKKKRCGKKKKKKKK
jgi:hypothetical protein